MSDRLAARRIPWTALFFSAVVIVSAVAAPGGCYNPHVESGHLRCALTTPACPDGFSCVGGLCVSGSGPGGASGAGGVGGAGGAGGTCSNPIAPLCTPAQAPAVCDPVCQTGCACGQRCQISAAGPQCVATLGALTVGQVCKPKEDACAPGLTCLQEICGNDLGRCYRFCDQTSCGPTGVCGTPVLLPDKTESGQHVCDLAAQECDPYTHTGCADPALGCYVTGPSKTICDCPSGANRQLGESCVAYADCAVGLACLRIGGAQGVLTCVKLCEDGTDCPTTTCMPFGATFGYCTPAP